MMFMTPMPPTSSEMAAMAEMPSETVLIIFLYSWIKLEMLLVVTVQVSLWV